jgi:hypothetical protein
MAGCRCSECRRANTDYEKARARARKAGEWNGLVSADQVRAHMAKLSKIGVGRRAVADVSGVSDSALVQIIAGRKTQLRALTARRILAVTKEAAADHALVCAKPSWRLLDELLSDGYTKAELALALGNRSPALQLGRKRVTVRNAFEVQRLHARLQFCAASQTLALLQELSAEGFRRDRLLKMLVTLAATVGADAPDLTVRDGRIRRSTAMLVQRLHAQLTE